jgi:hypothetical protein
MENLYVKEDLAIDVMRRLTSSPSDSLSRDEKEPKAKSPSKVRSYVTSLSSCSIDRESNLGETFLLIISFACYRDTVSRSERELRE